MLLVIGYDVDFERDFKKSEILEELKTHKNEIASEVYTYLRRLLDLETTIFASEIDIETRADLANLPIYNKIATYNTYAMLNNLLVNTDKLPVLRVADGKNLRNFDEYINPVLTRTLGAMIEFDQAGIIPGYDVFKYCYTRERLSPREIRRIGDLTLCTGEVLSKEERKNFVASAKRNMEENNKKAESYKNVSVSVGDRIEVRRKYDYRSLLKAEIDRQLLVKHRKQPSLSEREKIILEDLVYYYGLLLKGMNIDPKKLSEFTGYVSQYDGTNSQLKRLSLHQRAIKSNPDSQLIIDKRLY